jgi:hypothetical protein
MTDQWDPHEEPTANELAAVEALMARASAAGSMGDDLWAEVPDWLEASIVDTITAEVARSASVSAAPVTSLADRRAQRARFGWIAAAAAVVLLVAGVAAFLAQPSGSTGIAFAMSGTEAAPGASAAVELFDTPAGLKILIDVDGLDGAPPDYFYEAWISDGTRRVSAGTFHLRNGDDQIELWAGVVDASFTTFAVTLEPLDGVADSSGDVRLRGTFSLSGR